MTVSDLGSLGEFIASIVVVVSVLYLAIQMRQTKIIERGNAERELLMQAREWWKAYSENETIFNAISECLQDYEGADRYKQAQFNSWLWSMQNIIEQVFYQRRDGFMNDALFNGFTTGMLSIINTPGGAQWWREASKITASDVGEYMDDRLKREKDSLPRWFDLVPHLKLPS